jgi:hypothetical protein
LLFLNSSSYKGADSTISNYYSETALTYAEDLSLKNDDDILMMLTDSQGELPWIKHSKHFFNSFIFKLFTNFLQIIFFFSFFSFSFFSFSFSFFFFSTGMKWHIEEDQWKISEKVLHEERLHFRRSTNKGSMIKFHSRSKSKRRLNIPVISGTNNNTNNKMKFNIDYGSWFGEGSKTLDNSNLFEREVRCQQKS